ncbi:hypothetical protein [Sphaerimonospora thailandensis]|uniref:hypothetical protein n=1 Tax=Sphaerimonospora thailandensis TaxID=795644 RepID=UPI00194E5A99|nr:hypothetical protein [Sphaerimonospora thailandensis]
MIDGLPAGVRLGTVAAARRGTMEEKVDLARSYLSSQDLEKDYRIRQDLERN